jgi:hypothetical protein
MSAEDNKKKSIEILINAVIVSQSKGAFGLKDAALLHTAILSLTSDDKKIEEKEAISALIQASAICQKAGAFTLNDASAVFSAVKFFEENPVNDNTTTKLEPIKEEDEKIKEI